LKRHPDVNATDWANWLGVATGAGAVLLWLAAGSPAGALAAQERLGLFAVLSIVTGLGSAWLATVLWNAAGVHSRHPGVRPGPSLPHRLNGLLASSRSRFTV
jgi:hypothetical protein